MPELCDGPRSPLFHPAPFRGNATFADLAKAKVSERLVQSLDHAPRGACVSWGIPFTVNDVILLHDAPVDVKLKPLKTPWLVFLHTTDTEPLEWNQHGFVSPTRGVGRLRERVANYVIRYADGSEETLPIRRRHQIGMFARGWGENCFEAVAHHKPYPIRPLHEQTPVDAAATAGMLWGWTQTRAASGDLGPWVNWLWAWENPAPTKAIVGIRFEPLAGTVIVSGVTAGAASSNPLRWESRSKALLKLPKNAAFDFTVDPHGLLKTLQLDMGQVISAQKRTVYHNAAWPKSYNNAVPGVSDNEVLVEYAAHPDARFHLGKGKPVAVAQLFTGNAAGPLTPIAAATQRVNVRIVDKATKKPVAVKFHAHGEAGEYLAPVDRHRIPNAAWFEDYSADYLNENIHCCTYILGETVIDLPLGSVYIEVSKGFEIRPVRKAVKITKATQEIVIPIEKVLPWRERGWVTSDTHVHFLSPQTALLEGAGEGVNVVNLLASQWGELMTNVGDFDGKTTFGAREAGGDGEWLVRVGTENRQHVMGHISLLGYSGRIIAPMTTGGADESAIGDPVGALMIEWARQCRKQGGLVVMPHFPNPRAENAATMLDGNVDAIEMASWGNLYGGIDPYLLSDWYRYLNCGYFFPCVGGTDKMSANTAVGAVRTYAHIADGREFTYAAFKDAVRAGETFVTYGPLMEFSVDGHPAGTRIRMAKGGGTVDVSWKVASVTVPMTRLDLIVNGEIRESKSVKPWEESGHWSIHVPRSSWIALLLRGHYRDKPEIVAAHSSPVMVEVEGSPFFAPADGVTILEQIEGALAFLDTIGTRAETKAYKRMKLTLTAAHRALHNRLHRMGHYHEHAAPADHEEHHR